VTMRYVPANVSMTSKGHPLDSYRNAKSAGAEIIGWVVSTSPRATCKCASSIGRSLYLKTLLNQNRAAHIDVGRYGHRVNDYAFVA
jgi:hypothetical protein